jgi:hypothetical protein
LDHRFLPFTLSEGFVKKSIVLCLPTLNTFYPK